MFSLVDRISTEGSLIKIYEGQRDVNRNEGVKLSAITEEVEIKKYIKKVDDILENLLAAKEYGSYYVLQCRMQELKNGYRKNGEKCLRIDNPLMMKENLIRKLGVSESFLSVSL